MDKKQKHDNFRKICGLYISIALLIIWHSQTSAATQSLESIEKQVYQFVSTAYQHEQANIQVQGIDKRLKLHKCQNKLLINWHNRVQSGRNLIKVQCNSSKQWKLYVPVKLEIFKPVYIAKSAIQRGETIGKLNTERKVLDIGKLHRGYIQNITPFDERKTRRLIRKGEVLNHNMFAVQHIVKRGQQIILETGNKAINIKTKGTALSNGQKGDLIKVKNNASSIIVEAIVKEHGRAIVLY